MPDLISALIAFVAEHRRCGEIDATVESRENGRPAWVELRCSCGGRLRRPGDEA